MATNKLFIFTIALDAMPFLPTLFATFNRLPASIDWHWSVAEGAAMNVLDTRWCQPQAPRLSKDGTSQFLAGLWKHPRVTVHQRPSWKGKVEMCNTCLADFKEPGVLLEVDADECWLPHQIEAIVHMFNVWKGIQCARFCCRYFVGPNIVITSANNYGNRASEWLRAWRFTPARRFQTHEPPYLEAANTPFATREETYDRGLVFDHYSYAFESQVALKEQFYGYRDAVKHWRRLQANDKWPVADLHEYLPWVDRGVTADVLWKPRSTLPLGATATSSPRSPSSSTRLPRADTPA